MDNATNSEQPKARRSLQDVVLLLAKAVNEAKEREVKMNRHLGYKDDYQLGSMAVSLRWDDAATLLASAMVDILRYETAPLKDELEAAWGIIANAGGGDWQKESPEWREAAAKWRG